MPLSLDVAPLFHCIPVRVLFPLHTWTLSLFIPVYLSVSVVPLYLSLFEHCPPLSLYHWTLSPFTPVSLDVVPLHPCIPRRCPPSPLCPWMLSLFIPLFLDFSPFIPTVYPMKLSPFIPLSIDVVPLYPLFIDPCILGHCLPYPCIPGRCLPLLSLYYWMLSSPLSLYYWTLSPLIPVSLDDVSPCYSCIPDHYLPLSQYPWSPVSLFMLQVILASACQIGILC